MKIDSHQHFWLFNEREYGWIGENMQILRKNYLPSDLLPELESMDFQGSVAVQARQTLEETKWLLDLAEKNPRIKGVVGWVDLCSDNIEKQLEHYSQNPKLVGVRHVLHDEPDDNFMLNTKFLRGIRLLEKFNLTYDVLVFPKHLANSWKLVSLFPEITFIVDHIAKPRIKEGILSPWKEDLERLATLPNVYCKVSGMVTEADWHGWQPSHFKPYLDVVFNAFGTGRVMIGSDWPVCRVTGEYHAVLGIVLDYVKDLSPDEQANVLGLNAVKAYNLKIA